MNTYDLGLYEKSMPNSLTMREKLVETKLAGFDFMEISIDESDEKLDRLNWTAAERLDVVQAMSETGTRIQTMCLSGHRKYPIGSEDETVRTTGMRIMAQAIDLAVDLGIRVIQIAGYDEYYRPSTKNTSRVFTENLQICVRMAARKGVILAFETMETPFINTVQKAMAHVLEMNSPYLQIYPDLGNITNAAVLYHTDVLQDLAAGIGHIAAMHLKETIPGKFREIPYGTGHVNFKDAIDLMLQSGVQLFVGEFWYTGNSDWREQLSYANRFIRNQFSLI